MKNALFIVGPTATGKTDLAFKISRNIPSILISADSVQVYKDADIVSGKDRSIKTYLLDILSPNQSFSVRDFVERVRPLVEQAKKENKIPIIVGGTGFYIDALFGKIDTLSIPPNKTLREKLEKLSVKKLQEKFKKLSLERFLKMNKSDVNNKRRLIRAIEIAFAQGPTLGINTRDYARSRVGPLFKQNEVLTIGLWTSINSLKERIANRAKQRIKMGALAEVKRLFANYKNLSPQLKAATGYKQLFSYLASRITFDKAVEKWITAERQLAKYQMTWLNRNKNIIWFDIGQKDFEAEILRLIRSAFA